MPQMSHVSATSYDRSRYSMPQASSSQDIIAPSVAITPGQNEEPERIAPTKVIEYVQMRPSTQEPEQQPQQKTTKMIQMERNEQNQGLRVVPYQRNYAETSTSPNVI